MYKFVKKVEKKVYLFKDVVRNVYVLYDNENDNIKAFIAIWRFDDFAFVEHFVVSSLYRNGKEHAFKEGEGDRSLEYWREVHKKFFRECLEEYGLEFSENMKVVCEEFEVVY